MPGVFNQITFTVDQEDANVYQLATELEAQGWLKTVCNPVCEIACRLDMVPFNGFPAAYLISPPAGVSHPLVLVVDNLRGYVPDPSWEVIETGSTSSATVIDTVAGVFAEMGTVHGSLSTLPDADPDQVFPHRLLENVQLDPNPLVQLDDLPTVGSALNINLVVPLLFGGYVLSKGNLNLFIGRRYGVDSLNREGPVTMIASHTLSAFDTPLLTNAVGRSNCTEQTSFNYEGFSYYANENFFFLYDNATGNFHATAFQLETIDGSNITEACFATFGNLHAASFRNGLRSGGEYMIKINDDVGYDFSNDDINMPRIMAVLSGNSLGHLWENDLGQISEPWIAMHMEVGHRSGVVGRLPLGLVAHKRFTADSVDPFIWDGKVFKVVSNLIPTSNNSGFGSLCLEVSEDGVEPCGANV